MSSREIAELTGKRHDHVLRDIRNMLDDLDITAPSFGASYQDTTGRTLPMYALPKDLTITLVSGYSVPMRHRIVTRWMELEQQGGALKVPTTFREALLLAAEQQERIEALRLEMAGASKKVDALQEDLEEAAPKTRQIARCLKKLRRACRCIP